MKYINLYSYVHQMGLNIYGRIKDMSVRNKTKHKSKGTWQCIRHFNLEMLHFKCLSCL